MSAHEFLSESLSHQAENQAINFVCLTVDSVFVDEDTNGRAREPTDGDLHLVIFEELLRLFDKLKPVFFLQAGKDLIVPVITNVREPAGKDDQCGFLGSHHHRLEKALVHVVVVDKAGADDDVERILEILRELIDESQVKFDQVRINGLVSRLLHHTGRNVNADDVLEAPVCELLAD